MDKRMCPLAIGPVCVKNKLHAQICYYILFHINTVDWHGIGKGGFPHEH
jgi:hypothetical protein